MPIITMPDGRQYNPHKGEYPGQEDRMRERLARIKAGGYSASNDDLDRMDKFNQGLEFANRHLTNDPNLQRVRALREQQAKGYSTPELAARKQLTVNEQDATRAKTVQALKSNLARSGVGGARGAAMQASADSTLAASNADQNRKLLLDEADQQNKGIDALSKDIYNEKLGQLGLGVGFAQLGSADKAAEAARQANSGGDSGLCCFIFLEARYGTGAMDSVVRKFRDENLTEKNRRGYYKLSEVLVPLMRKHKTVKAAVQLFMTSPLVAYGKAYYGQGSKLGFIFKPLVNFWLKTFDYLGGDHKFIRENGEVI